MNCIEIGITNMVISEFKHRSISIFKHLGIEFLKVLGNTLKQHIHKYVNINMSMYIYVVTKVFE